MRRLKILEYALGSLWRRRARHLAVLTVYAGIVAGVGSVLLLTEALRVEAHRLLGEAPDLVVQRLVAGRHDLIPTDYADSFTGLPGVGAVRPRVWGYHFDPLTGANYTMLGLAGDGGSATLEVLVGELPDRFAECAVGTGVAAARGLSIGSPLVLVDARGVGTELEVVGVFRASSVLLTNDLVVLREDDLREFFAFPPGMATDIVVEVRNEREVATVAAKVARLFPDTRPITRRDILRTYDAVFSWRSALLLVVLAAALVAFAILAWERASGIGGDERREIGLLKAVGWSTGDVLELRLWEGLVVSVTALQLGLLIALVHVFVLGAPLLAPVLAGWSVLFPELRPTPHVDPLHLLVLALLVVGPYLAGTAVPSWRAAITDPEEVIRG